MASNTNDMYMEFVCIGIILKEQMIIASSRLGGTESAVHALDLLVICQVCLRLVDRDNWIAPPLKNGQYQTFWYMAGLIASHLTPLAQEADIGQSGSIRTL